ncbi:Glycine-rich domain-containing protein 1, partial [Candida tropicalis]
MLVTRHPDRINDEISKDVTTTSQEFHADISKKPNPAVPSLQDILRRVRSNNRYRSAAQRLILGGYYKFNVISFTVPNSIQIGEDLVDCVIRQGSFVEKMNKLNWLNSPLRNEGLSESLVRYRRFFELLTEKTLNRMLVPTLDIDFMWHTHQLSLYGYIRDCKSSPCQRVIDHNDKVGQKPLDDGFAFTSKLYKLKFKEEYSVCFCNYCVAKRASKRSKISRAFKSSKKLKAEQETMQSSPLFLQNGEGMTHVGEHCSVVQFVKCAGTPGACA